MKDLKPLYTLASILFLAMLLPGCAVERKCGLEGCSSDERITASVRAVFDQHPDLGPPAAIQVEARNRVVYLNGTVGEGLERDAATTLASQVPGVARVVNNIAVTH
jgi:osmotically-inducible protein OsmY